MRALIAAGFVALAVPISAQAPSLKQALSMASVSSPVISPDGKYVAYVRSQANWERNDYDRQIWIVDVATKSHRRLTRQGTLNTSPSWSPDGKRIAFLSNRSTTPQVYILPVEGGEAQALTALEQGAGSFQWSPDGKNMALVVSADEADDRKKEKETFGSFTIADREGAPDRLALLPCPEDLPEKPATPTILTDKQPFTVGSYRWSPDGSRIAFDAQPGKDFIYGKDSDIYVLDLNTKGIKKIVDTPGTDGNPVWSPDGTKIAFETVANDPNYFYSNGLLAVVPAGGGKPAVLTSDFDESANLIDWAPEGILFSAQIKTASHVFRLDPSTKAVTRITAPDGGIFAAPSFNFDCSKMAFVSQNTGRYPEIGYSIREPFIPNLLTTMSSQLTGFKPASQEVVRWKSKDGAEIEGVLMKPVNFDPAKKYPLLVSIHGGPTGVSYPATFPDRTYPVEAFVAKGALVLLPNYRGSAGYGAKFRALNVRNLGVGDAWDVLSGVDYLIGQGFVDPNRMGCMGWSQGGYISAFLTATTDRFKAISVGAGISDWITYYYATDITEFTRQYLKANPWTDPDIYKVTSPISYIKNAKTPTLIQHGSNDQRVPIANARELYRALQDLGVPSKLVVYNGFGHGITKPKEQLAVMTHNWEWFLQYVWGEKAKP